MKGRIRGQITCAYCEQRFDDKGEWLEHIPCPEAVEAVGAYRELRESVLVVD